MFMFLQLAHAGDAHAMNATVLMGWCGWGCVHVPSTCTRHECYGECGVGSGCVHVPSTCTRGAWGWGWGGGVMLTFN